MKATRRKQFIERIVLICDPDEAAKYRQRLFDDGYSIVYNTRVVGSKKVMRPAEDRIKFVAEKEIIKEPK
jgi:hypothetical protein